MIIRRQFVGGRAFDVESVTERSPDDDEDDEGLHLAIGGGCGRCLLQLQQDGSHAGDVLGVA